MKHTQDEIIHLAEEFIRTRGYNGFSYADIASVMDVRNASIHYHFPSKTDLGIAVIEKELRAIAIARMYESHLPGAEQLKKVIETFFFNSRKGYTCLTGSLTPEYKTFPEPLREKVKEMSQAILEWMAACLEKGRSEGTLSFEGKAEDRALLVMAGLLSSLLLSRVLGWDIFDNMIDRLLQDMRAPFRISELEEERFPHLE